MTWYCAATERRKEFKALQSLSEAGLEPFLPHYKKSERGRRKTGRHEKVCAPLYPGYIFCNADDWTAIAGSKYIARVLMMCGTDTAAAIPDEQIERIRVDCRDGLMDIRGKREAAVRAGDICRIIEGIWTGFSGVAKGDADRERVRLEMNTAGRSQEIELPVSIVSVDNI